VRQHALIPPFLLVNVLVNLIVVNQMDRYWRCGHYSNRRILKCPETGREATSYPIRHPRTATLLTSMPIIKLFCQTSRLWRVGDVVVALRRQNQLRKLEDTWPMDGFCTYKYQLAT